MGPPVCGRVTDHGKLQDFAVRQPRLPPAVHGQFDLDSGRPVHVVALPWLVLKLTGDPQQLGFVLALMALPLAVFVLVGGAVVDRMSPRKVLLNSRAVNAVLIAILATLVLAGAIQMWEVYLLALGIGLSTAFSYPARPAILPQLLEPAQLAQANPTLMRVR